MRKTSKTNRQPQISEGAAVLDDLLKSIESGKLSAGRAARLISQKYERDLGFARIDVDRHKRCGLPEVIYCPGKTGRQIAEIMAAMLKTGQNILATRAVPEQYTVVRRKCRRAVYHEQAGIITLISKRPPEIAGKIAVICAGTSDIPVAEEAALTAEFMGARVVRIYDAGVAGLHRLVKHLPVLRETRALVVAAGMEGALPSVVGGLINRPIIAVPTSVGYGANLKGFSALLAMLNSCVPGITVVNIDNGFSAGVAAAMIAGESAKR
ncbi:MAG: nickel pincer cofactor biosynthesis protein LarB [Kiritimatiellae bacterium]|nr:nickel pincer cofactor biosynthesis protein LarB [Kiritimatiellia bacterium]